MFGAHTQSGAHVKITSNVKSQNRETHTLTVNQRQKISEDGKSATHFYGTIGSVVSDEGSKLRCSVDMPDVWSLYRHSAGASCRIAELFHNNPAMKFAEPSLGTAHHFALQHKAATRSDALLLSVSCNSCRSRVRCRCLHPICDQLLQVYSSSGAISDNR